MDSCERFSAEDDDVAVEGVGRERGGVVGVGAVERRRALLKFGVEVEGFVGGKRVLFSALYGREEDVGEGGFERELGVEKRWGGLFGLWLWFWGLLPRGHFGGRSIEISGW